MDVTGIVNGWQIRMTAEGAFCIWGKETYRAGPFVTAEQAMAAALRLPRIISRNRVTRPPRRSVRVGYRAPAR